MNLNDYTRIHFIGVAGTGMSAIAQYLAGTGKEVSGSDRYFTPGKQSDILVKLTAAGINCHEQDGSGITPDVQLVIVSTAIEDTVPEVQKTRSLNIPILRRSEVLSQIALGKRTIAVGGTSGKSTTSAMLYDILKHAGFAPGIISGAGLVSLIEEGRIGNADVGDGKWLIIEADESDGSIVLYKPEIGLLLNIDKDHQEIDELVSIFTTFKRNTTSHFVVNNDNAYTKALSGNSKNDFSTDPASGCGYTATGFSQHKMQISFRINDVPFEMNTVGRHNMENAAAAVAVAGHLGISLEQCAEALKNYKGIYRRHQLLQEKNGVYLVDDYAHNPVKCASSIRACQDIAPKVIAWFQPHGYGPTRFLKDDFIEEISVSLRPDDEIWMSEIFYAGGTAVKDISSKDLVDGITSAGKKAFFVEDRNNFMKEVKSHLDNNCVLLLMGARDPSLEDFAESVSRSL